MKKLIRGILEFRRNRLSDYRETFARLALGQAPDTLFIACSDSRVAPNLFASTDPGDLFVVRNVGNLVPPYGSGDSAVGAAIEFSLKALPIKDVIVCGHSECGAMQAIHSGRPLPQSPRLDRWLENGRESLALMKESPDPDIAPYNHLSQLNVLRQMEHLRSYPDVHRRIEEGTLSLHGWWFDIARVDVQWYDPRLGRFLLIDEREVERRRKESSDPS